MRLWLALACHDDDAAPCAEQRWFVDRDGDSFGAGAPVDRCGPPRVGYADRDGDCVDTVPWIHPGSPEHCDGIDEDCDGVVDEDPALERTWPDADHDGYGDASAVPAVNCIARGGLASVGGDCDDHDREVHPDGEETCAATDEDCDGLVNDADFVVGPRDTWFRDADGDGHGDPHVRASACDASPGWVRSFDDCDDGDGTVQPDAVEICGGADEDCDGAVDGADDDLAEIAGWWVDADADGLGDPTRPSGCTTPGSVDNALDCDDGDPAVGVDQHWRTDLDHDGFGAGPETTGSGCDATDPDLAPIGVGLDCDDADPSRFPGAEDACSDGVDQDCDGTDDPCGAQGGGSLAEASLYLDRLGSAVGGGDLDGDGIPDLAVSGGLGGVRIVPGPATGAVPVDAFVESVPDTYAIAVGDLGGDDVSDLVLSDDDEVWVLSGPVTTPFTRADADLEVIVGLPHYGVVLVGDQDGDSIGDFVLVRGAHEVRFVPGGTGTWQERDLEVVFDGTFVGDVIGAGGDGDGDGLDDLAVGLPYYDWRGEVRLFAGPLNQPEPDPVAVLRGTDVADEAGSGVAMGDLDGDGRDDVVAASVDAGEVYVAPFAAADAELLDATALLLAPLRTEDFGAVLTVPGDTDRDGFDDLLIGAPASRDVGTGSVWVYTGPLAGTRDDADARWFGDDGGWWVGGVGDLDGNGADDWATEARCGGTGLFVIRSDTP